jgi:hypothetical protein
MEMAKKKLPHIEADEQRGMDGASPRHNASETTPRMHRRGSEASERIEPLSLRAR